MIIIKIQGGLGNQMFQYALGRNLSLLHNVPFKIDRSYLRSANQSRRVFWLDNFNTILEEAAPAEIDRYRSTLQKILDRIRPESKKKKIVELSQVFDSDVLSRTDGYFDGHWNNEKYFKDNENIIRKDFTLRRPFDPQALEIARRIASYKNATSLHIRRGDYLSIPKIANIYNALPFSYYKKAMTKILEKHPDAHFFVSSDDINWVKNNFPKNYPVTFVSSPEISASEEIVLMSKCKHNIIANSTFSWWGAWLNVNPEKIIIAPKDWFKDKDKNQNGLTPQIWIKM